MTSTPGPVFGWKAKTLCTLLAGAITANPAPAQDTRHVDTTGPPVENISKRLANGALTIAINTAGTTALSVFRGQPLVHSLKQAAAVHTGMETIRVFDGVVAGTPLANTPLRYISSQVGNSMIRNITTGNDLCSDIEAHYLAAKISYDCGEYSIRPTAAGLLESGVHLIAGGQLEVAKTISRGMPVFSYSQEQFCRERSSPHDECEFVRPPLGIYGWNSLSRGVAIGKSLAYRVEPTPRAHAGLADKLQEYSPENQEQQEARQNLLRDIRQWEVFTNKFMDRVIGHETDHVSQDDLQHKIIASFEETPWWVTKTIEIGDTQRVLTIPTGKAAYLLATAILPHRSRPHEFLAKLRHPTEFRADTHYRVILSGNDVQRIEVRSLNPHN